MTKPDNLRSTLRQDNLDLGIVHHGTRYLRHDRYADDIPSILGVPVGGVLERRVPTQREAVVPASHKGVTWFHFEKTVLGRFDIAGDGRCGTKLRGGNITDEVVVVDIADACREI